MIIEFVGLPGSGKTTLYQNLTRKLATSESVLSPQNVRVQYIADPYGSFRSKMVAHLNTLITYPKFFTSCLYSIWWSSRSASDKVLATRWFAVTLDNYAYLSRQKPHIHRIVFDEGITQRAFLVMVDAKNKIPPDTIRKYVLAMPKPDVLIYLKISPQTAVQRVQERPTGITARLQQLSASELACVMQRAQDMFDILIDCLKTQDGGFTTVLELDTSNLTLAATQLEALIDKYISRQVSDS